MAFQISFGSFSEDEISDLFTEDIADLQFVWQSNGKLRCDIGSTVTPSKSQFLKIPCLTDREKRSFSPDILSPNIPPNPPTSPVEEVQPATGETQDTRRLPHLVPRKLNVNALPFIPGAPTTVEAGQGAGLEEKNKNHSVDSSKSGNVPEKCGVVDDVQSSTVRQLDFSSTKDTGLESCADSSQRIGRELGRDSESVSSESGGKSPWPNLVSVQTSGQVTADSRTSNDQRGHEADTCKVLSDSLSSPSPSGEGGVVNDPPSSQLSAANVVSTSTQALRTTIASPESTSSATPNTRSELSPVQAPLVSSSVESESPHERGGDFAPGHDSSSAVFPGLSETTTVAGSRTTPTSTSDQTKSDDLHRILHVTTPTDTPTTTSQLVSSETSKARNSSTERPPSDSTHLHNKVSSPEPIPNPTSELGATPSIGATPTVGGVAKTQVKSWASIVSRTSDGSSTAAQANSVIPGTQNQFPSSAVPSRTSVQKLPERGCKEAGPGTNGAGSGRGGAAFPKGKLGNDRTNHVTQLKLLGEQLQKWDMSHKSKSIQPRGLVNQGNWCYMHAPLQALLSIPAFCNLFRTFNPNPPLTKEPSVTPFMEAMIQFVHEFKDYPRTSATSLSNSSNNTSSRKKRPHSNDLLIGDPFRPEYVYEMLHSIRSNLSYKGRQEDAEEFLGCMLDGLHEELVSAKKTLLDVDTEDRGANVLNHHTPPSSTSSCSELSPVSSSPEGEGQGDEEWEQVGPKNKSTITRQTSFSESPITEIFGGQLRSALHRQGAKESATFEPFFSLQLDIQSEAITSVKEALDALTVKETVHMSEVDAYKRLSLARLPPVLIFHLKRFIFTSSGSQKLFKHIHYTTEMELAKELLAPAIKSKVTQSQRTYRLWAVVYHHGKTATGGHYTSDVYHSGYGGWIRVDDSLLKSIPDDFVLKPGGGVVNKNAYLLFYRRMDTIRD